LITYESPVKNLEQLIWVVNSKCFQLQVCSSRYDFNGVADSEGVYVGAHEVDIGVAIVVAVGRIGPEHAVVLEADICDGFGHALIAVGSVSLHHEHTLVRTCGCADAGVTLRVLVSSHRSRELRSEVSHSRPERTNLVCVPRSLITRKVREYDVKVFLLLERVCGVVNDVILYLIKELVLVFGGAGQV